MPDLLSRREGGGERLVEVGVPEREAGLREPLGQRPLAAEEELPTG